MSIFNIHWNNVVENLTPSFWRKTKTDTEAKIIAYLRSIIAPMQGLSDILLELQQKTTRFLDYNGQHLALENYLNDNYDVVDRRIFITENNIVNSVANIDLYLQPETDPTPVSVYLQSEVNPIPFAFHLQGETPVIQYNFTINIPLSVTFDAIVVTRQVKNYSEAAKTFNIITF